MQDPFRACHEQNKWRSFKVREKIAFRIQPVESTKRAHFGNFALISHTRFAVWCKSHTTGHISAETNPRALRLPVASIKLKPVSKISPAISRPGEKQTSRRDVRNMHMHSHANACRLGCSRKRVWLRREDGNPSFSFSFFLTLRISLFHSVPFPLPFPVLLPRTRGAGYGLSGSTRRIPTM